MELYAEWNSGKRLYAFDNLSSSELPMQQRHHWQTIRCRLEIGIEATFTISFAQCCAVLITKRSSRHLLPCHIRKTALRAVEERTLEFQRVTFLTVDFQHWQPHGCKQAYVAKPSGSMKTPAESSAASLHNFAWHGGVSRSLSSRRGGCVPLPTTVLSDAAASYKHC